MQDLEATLPLFSQLPAMAAIAAAYGAEDPVTVAQAAMEQFKHHPVDERSLRDVVAWIRTFASEAAASDAGRPQRPSRDAQEIAGLLAEASEIVADYPLDAPRWTPREALSRIAEADHERWLEIRQLRDQIAELLPWAHHGAVCVAQQWERGLAEPGVLADGRTSTCIADAYDLLDRRAAGEFGPLDATEEVQA